MHTKNPPAPPMLGTPDESMMVAVVDGWMVGKGSGAQCKDHLQPSLAIPVPRQEAEPVASARKGSNEFISCWL